MNLFQLMDIAVDPVPDPVGRVWLYVVITAVVLIAAVAVVLIVRAAKKKK